MKKISWKKVVILSAVVVFLLIVIGTALASNSIVQFSKLDEKTNCDTVIILGAATTNGEVNLCIGKGSTTAFGFMKTDMWTA